MTPFLAMDSSTAELGFCRIGVHGRYSLCLLARLAYAKFLYTITLSGLGLAEPKTRAECYGQPRAQWLLYLVPLLRNLPFTFAVFLRFERERNPT